MEPVLFFGGGALTALIALGILPWGALGIGICATLTFIGISRFVLTNSWTWWHNRWTEGKKENDEENLDKGNYTQTNEQEEKGDEEKYGTGFVKSDINLLKMVKYRVSPIILAVAGIVFGVLGATGVLGLGLALGIAIPSLIFAVITLKKFEPSKRLPYESDNVWGVSMLVAGLLSFATFAVLGLTGVLVLPTAIALGAPGLVLAGSMALIFVATRIGFEVKNRRKSPYKPLPYNSLCDPYERKESCSFIGLYWNPGLKNKEQQSRRYVDLDVLIDRLDIDSPDDVDMNK